MQHNNFVGNERGMFSRKKFLPMNPVYSIGTPAVDQQQQQQGKNNEAADNSENVPANQMPPDLDEADTTHRVQTDTFVNYAPLRLRSGFPHPDEVVETLSLSSVSSPEIRYTMAIPDEVVDGGRISNLQLEAALYACQAHQRFLPSGERIGYLIGDGAGVGKGRTIAAIIFENFLRGRRKAIWLSVSSDLKYDAERDLRDIGADKIAVCALNKLRYGRNGSESGGGIGRGVIFATYSSLIGESRRGGTAKGGKSAYADGTDGITNDTKAATTVALVGASFLPLIPSRPTMTFKNGCWHFSASEQMCHHRFFYGKCSTEVKGTFCEIGRRMRTYFVLSGSLICVWPELEQILSTDGKGGKRSLPRRMQIVRVRTDSKQRIVVWLDAIFGYTIRGHQISALTNCLFFIQCKRRAKATAGK